MSEPHAQIARQAAAKLAETTTPQLPQLTEGVLAQGGGTDRAQTYDAATAIGLASFLVGIASLAWTIYQDCKKATSPPRPDPIERQIRVQLEVPNGISVAQRRVDLDAAQDWYQRSLEILESLGDRLATAASYHQLGMVAQHRGDFEAAQDWYQRSLEILESLGDRPGMANSYGQLGLLAEAAGRAIEALDWMVRCVSLFPEFPHPATGPGPRHLARLTGELGMSELEASWQRCTGQPLPDHIRRALEV